MIKLTFGRFIGQINDVPTFVNAYSNDRFQL